MAPAASAAGASGESPETNDALSADPAPVHTDLDGEGWSFQQNDVVSTAADPLLLTDQYEQQISA